MSDYTPLVMVTETPDLVGKTIAKAHEHSEDGPLILMFTDGSIAVCRAECCDEDRLVLLDNQVSDMELRDAYVIDQEEFSRRYNAEREADAAKYEAYEREQYERLKAKFEPANRDLEESLRELIVAVEIVDGQEPPDADCVSHLHDRIRRARSVLTN